MSSKRAGSFSRMLFENKARWTYWLAESITCMYHNALSMYILVPGYSYQYKHDENYYKIHSRERKQYPVNDSADIYLFIYLYNVLRG